MTQATQVSPPARKSLPLVGALPLQPQADGRLLSDEEIERNLKMYAHAERERMGMRQQRQHWVDSMIDANFTKQERAHITILNCGLTNAQDFLVEGALRGVGYNMKCIGTPDSASMQIGKEYGNRGQCNPTYFTVGHLIRYLIKLRDEDGISAEDIIANNIFLTAGACGPCRFGMYITEYRKALRDAGFDGFRVMLFQQQGGLDQATGADSGLELNPEFFIAVIKAIVVGDVLNALAYRIRPFEVQRGATDRAMEEAKRIGYKALLTRSNIFAALLKCRRLFAAIEVDKLRPAPKVAIIGEFWAMTTEGDGNYHLQRFLESEGAECDIQLTTAWLLYSIWEVARDTRERDGLRQADVANAGLAEFQGEFDVAMRQATLTAAELALRVGFQAFALPPGLHGYHLPDMNEVASLANDHYSNDLRGGEGHMEVGKLILNVLKNKATMTLSVKPFGCMPSSGVSDGVQSLITTKYPGTIFCAVETSGDGATNFYSRVQMYLYKARIAAEQELQQAYLKTGVSEQQVRDFLRAHPSYNSPLHHSPHVGASSAANVVFEVAPLITQSRMRRTKKMLAAAARSVAAGARAVPRKAGRGYRFVRDPDTRRRVKVDIMLARDVLSGKARERFGPLASRLLRRAWGHGDAPQAAATTSEAQPLAAE